MATIEIPDLVSTVLYACPECDEAAEEEPAYDKLYECNECGQKFVGSNGGGKNGNMCPDCGNKFGSRVDEGGKEGSPICESCLEGVVEENTFEVCPECEATDEDARFDTFEPYVRHYVENHY